MVCRTYCKHWSIVYSDGHIRFNLIQVVAHLSNLTYHCMTKSVHSEATILHTGLLIFCQHSFGQMKHWVRTFVTRLTVMNGLLTCKNHYCCKFLHRGNWLTQSSCFMFHKKVRLTFMIPMVSLHFHCFAQYSCKFYLKIWRSVRASSKGPSATLASSNSVVDSR